MRSLVGAKATGSAAIAAPSSAHSTREKVDRDDSQRPSRDRLGAGEQPEESVV
jgi:hypothetical protein